MAQRVKSYGIITLGALIYALAFDAFVAPNRFAMGGLTGLAQIINALVPALPVGVLSFLMNVPLFLAGWKLIGGHLLVSSLYAMAVSSLAIDGISLVYVFPAMDPILAALYGGVLVPDMVVVALVAVVFGTVDAALYGLIKTFVCSRLMDTVLYGLDTARVAYIITDRWREVSRALLEMRRGVTLLQGQGAYTGAEKHVLLVAFKQREVVQVKRLLREIDPAAFFIVCDAHEIFGEGFGDYQKEEI